LECLFYSIEGSSRSLDIVGISTRCAGVLVNVEGLQVYYGPDLSSAGKTETD
jgi:hypothetical protein